MQHCLLLVRLNKTLKKKKNVFQKRPAADFIDPLANKKPRISHLASKATTAPVNGRLSSSCGRGDAAAAQTAVSDVASGIQHLPMLEIPRPFEALSDVSNDSSHNGRDCDPQESAASERLGQPAALPTCSTGTLSPENSALQRPRVASPAPCSNKSRKKSKKHKDKEKSKDREKEKGQTQPKQSEKKSLEGSVPAPDRPSESSSETVRCNTIPQKSTGEAQTHTRWEIKFPPQSNQAALSSSEFLNQSATWCVDGLHLVITVSRCSDVACVTQRLRGGDPCCSYLCTPKG